MPIDPSIIAGIRPPQMPNPLAMVGQAAQVQNAVNQNRLFQSTQAAGQAYQQAIDPSTGKLDVPTFNRLIAGNPVAAMAVPTEMSRGQALQGQQQGLSVAQQTQAASLIGSQLTQPDAAQTRQSYEDRIAYAAQSGIIDQAHAQALLQHLPPDGAPPGAFRQFGTTMLIAGLAGPQVAQQAFGTPVTIQNGQSITGGVQRSAAAGGALDPSGNPVQIYPSRSELINRTTIGVTPQGAPVGGPLSAVTPPDLAGPAAGSPFANGGRLPPALRGPNAEPRVPNGGAVVTGLGPAQTAAQAAMGTQSAGAFQGIADQGVQAQSQAATLANMLGDTSLFTTGPGQDWIKTKQAIVQRFAPGLAKSFGVSPDSIAANESFDKFANQLANAQGAGSDARMQVNQAANPSSHLTPAGADMIIRQLIGNADYLGARAKLAADYPNQADRPGFEASIASNLDPRVFQYSRMSPEQKGTFLTSMKSGKAAFKKAYGWASQQGLLSDPNAAQ